MADKKKKKLPSDAQLQPHTLAICLELLPHVGIKRFLDTLRLIATPSYTVTRIRYVYQIDTRQRLRYTDPTLSLFSQTVPHVRFGQCCKDD